MAGQKGKEMIIKIGDGAETPSFTTLCGIRSKTLAFNDASFDATAPDCTNPENPLYRELIGGGVKTADVSGDGVFKDSTSEETFRAVKFSNNPVEVFQIVIPDFGIVEGPFHIDSLEYAGSQDDVVTYTIALSSAGAFTFTAAA